MVQSVDMDVQPISGPEWDNTTEYPSILSPELQKDFKQAEALIIELEQLDMSLAQKLPQAAQGGNSREREQLVRLCQRMTRLRNQAYPLLSNVSVFTSCALSIEGRNSDAKKLHSRIQALSSRFEQSFQSLDLFLTLTTEEFIAAYLALPEFTPESFQLSQKRLLKSQLLSLEEERLITALEVDGHTAWENLYNNVSSSMSCKLKLPDGIQEMGLASAAGHLRSGREEVRKAAWTGINQAWEGEEEPCAAVLNSLAGWRLELNQRRSSVRGPGRAAIHFLEQPLHDNRISQKTLSAMFEAVDEAKGLGQEAVVSCARVLGKERMDPWDLGAPFKSAAGEKSKTYAFDEGLELIEQAFAGLDPQMADFVRTMKKNRWIEGRVLEGKRPGAYCTKFAKSRTPRVYMVYMGSMGHVRTLAHELGHAFHNWVMRDMPMIETRYSLSLAETASIFSETLVADHLAMTSPLSSDQLKIGWDDMESVSTFLLNVPARFDFEKAVYEKRKERTLTPDDFRSIMTDAWNNRYGPALSQADPMFWASKSHFYMAKVSFYNFPYIFGYLFSLGVYAQRERLGADFFSSYVNLLRDTGRMTAEEVALKHLGRNISDVGFWRESIEMVRAKVERFKALIP